MKDDGISGGLCLLWNDYYENQIIDTCLNYIHVAAGERKSGIFFDISFVYGNPTFAAIRSQWTRLANLKPPNDGDWCYVGDFNEMLNHSEKYGLETWSQSE